MAEINIYYNKETNTWWTNKEMDGFTLRSYIDKNPIGLGTVEFNADEKRLIKDLYEVSPVFIPKHIKQLNNITEDIKENGLDNAVKVTDEELNKLLK